MDVRLGKLEDGDDLQDIGDVDALRPPRTFGIAGGSGCVDHRRAEPAADRVEILRRLPHELAIRKPLCRNPVTHCDEADVALRARGRRGHHVDVVWPCGHNLRSRVVQHECHLRSAKAKVDRDDHEARTPEPARDLGARDRVERHPRDAIALLAAQVRERVGDPARTPVQRRKVEDFLAADHGGLVRQRLGVARQEVEFHAPDAKSARVKRR